jgi:hypothetical protein
VGYPTWEVAHSTFPQPSGLRVTSHVWRHRAPRPGVAEPNSGLAEPADTPGKIAGKPRESRGSKLASPGIDRCHKRPRLEQETPPMDMYALLARHDADAIASEIWYESTGTPRRVRVTTRAQGVTRRRRGNRRTGSV